MDGLTSETGKYNIYRTCFVCLFVCVCVDGLTSETGKYNIYVLCVSVCVWMAWLVSSCTLVSTYIQC